MQKIPHSGRPVIVNVLRHGVKTHLWWPCTTAGKERERNGGKRYAKNMGMIGLAIVNTLRSKWDLRLWSKGRQLSRHTGKLFKVSRSSIGA